VEGRLPEPELLAEELLEPELVEDELLEPQAASAKAASAQIKGAVLSLRIEDGPRLRRGTQNPTERRI
jgi:hypothetical protein